MAEDIFSGVVFAGCLGIAAVAAVKGESYAVVLAAAVAVQELRVRSARAHASGT